MKPADEADHRLDRYRQVGLFQDHPPHHWNGTAARIPDKGADALSVSGTYSNSTSYPYLIHGFHADALDLKEDGDEYESASYLRDYLVRFTALRFCRGRDKIISNRDRSCLVRQLHKHTF